MTLMDAVLLDATRFERERCARIARHEMERAKKRRAELGPNELAQWQFEEGVAKGAEWVLKAIERGDEE